MTSSVKKKAALGGGIAAIVGLAIYGLLNLFNGGGGGGLLPGSGSGQGEGSATGKRGSGSGESGLVITIEGEKYLIDGAAKTLAEAVAAAEEASKGQSSQSEARIVVKKKKTARFNTEQELEDELKRRGIRYRSEKDY
jgi:hypothetical protein